MLVMLLIIVYASVMYKSFAIVELGHLIIYVRIH